MGRNSLSIAKTPSLLEDSFFGRAELRYATPPNSRCRRLSRLRPFHTAPNRAGSCEHQRI